MKLSKIIDGGIGLPQTSLVEVDKTSASDNLEEPKIEEGGGT